MVRMTYRPLDDDDTLAQVYMYEAPMRLWHWMNAVAVVLLIVTGIVIGTPMPSQAGDPSAVYVMGWIRFVHLAVGYGLAVLWVLRLWWAAVGNDFARQLFFPGIWSRAWVRGLTGQIRWNLFLDSRACRYIGMNPLGHLTIIALFMMPLVVLMVTGFGMLAEVAGHNSWQYYLFGWMRDFAVNTMDLHTVHRAAMWVLTIFTTMHVYTVVREDVVSRQTMVSTMLSGYRLFRKTDS
jgi:Ni/Fe-hydrogenase 1 B-type cytochrome subunit